MREVRRREAGNAGDEKTHEATFVARVLDPTAAPGKFETWRPSGCGDCGMVAPASLPVRGERGNRHGGRCYHGTAQVPHLTFVDGLAAPSRAGPPRGLHRPSDQSIRRSALPAATRGSRAPWSRR